MKGCRGLARNTRSGKQTKSGSVPQKRLSLDERKPRQGLLDEYAKRDIAGVAFIVLAIVFMLMAAMPADGAVVSSALSAGVHLVLGSGCYVLPFVLAFIGITFLYRKGRDRLSLRAALGMAILYIALLGFMALFTPITTLGVDDPDLLFSERLLVSYGGYIGAGIAWAGITLLGRVISGVILVGIMVIGLVIVGFSITRLIERAGAKAHEFAERRQSASLSVQMAPARIRRQPASAARQAAPVAGMGATRDIPEVPFDEDLPAAEAAFDDAALTRQLPTAGKKRKLASRPAAAADLPAAADPNVTIALADLSAAEPKQTAPMTRKLGRARREEGAAPEHKPAKRAPAKAKASAAPITKDGFELPAMSLLAHASSTRKSAASAGELEQTAALLQQTLGDFGVPAKVVGWVAGPTVTLFKVDLPSGVRVSRITVLDTDIALALATPSVRIFAPIPGTNYVGIEVPNITRETVYLGDVLESAGDGPLQIAIGKDVEGNAIVSDLAKMPHLLIGGTTGSGKSVSVNAMIMSILMRATPAEVRFIMVDPKRVEFTPYNGIPHLYAPVVTEPREAAGALAWGVAEMERRLKVMSSAGVRNIAQYNQKAKAGSLPVEEGEEPPEPMPYIVIIIDELADLMMAVGKEVEFSICRIAQLARAAGIHLIVATQRPSTNVVTGLIKSNITNRIAFNVASGIDSRVIIDTTGAEHLIGLGDLLLSKPEYAKPMRIQGCYVSEEEIEAVVAKVKEQGEPDYHNEILQTNVVSLGSTDPSGGSSSGSDDPLVWEAAEIVVSSQMGSTSNIQRRLKVGYARAGRIMDQLEEKGIVGPANGSKPREVMVDELELETLRAFEEQDAKTG